MTYEIREVELSKLRLNTGQIEGVPKNPRFIKDSRFAALVKSIQDAPEMTELRELIAYDNGGELVVICGNMRMRAMKELKIKTAKVKVLSSDTPAEKLREYTIKDNVSFGSDDWDLLANEWDVPDLSDWGFELPEIDGPEDTDIDIEAKDDDFDEEDDEVDVRCKEGQIWKLGNHRLMCGDSTSDDCLSRLMDGTTADLVVTDPPYKVAVTNSKGLSIKNDNMSSNKFSEFLHDVFAASYKVMGKGCPFYVWYATREHINFENALNDNKLNVKQQLVWNKSQFVLGRSHYQWKHEVCLYGWKGDSCKYFVDIRNLSTVIEDAKSLDIDSMSKAEMKELIKKMYDSGIPTTVIEEKKPTVDSEHPTMKPVTLFARHVKNSSRPGDVVLDMFGGSGTTIIACEQLKRHARVMELDPHYCDVIIARWEKFTNQKAELIA